MRTRMSAPFPLRMSVLLCQCEMAAFVYIFAVLCVAASAAPPKPAQQPSAAVRQQPSAAALAPIREQPSAQLQQISPLEYYPNNQELHNYYSQQQKLQKNGDASAKPDQSSRLETLEPDSEVELIPGAQQPQQPPQQPPIAPNFPGLAPGQRVFIVHMPVPGYRPGTIGGYQPVYIVAAGPQGPQGNIGFPGNGYQNAVLLDPSYQLLSPLRYPRQGSNLLEYSAQGYGAPPSWWQVHQTPSAHLRVQPAKLQASSESLSAEQ